MLAGSLGRRSERAALTFLTPAGTPVLPMSALHPTARSVLPGRGAPVKNGPSGLANRAHTPLPGIPGGCPSSEPAGQLDLEPPQTQGSPPARPPPQRPLLSSRHPRPFRCPHVTPSRRARSDDLTRVDPPFSPRPRTKSPGCSRGRTAPAARPFPSIFCDLGLMLLSLS